MIGSFFMRGATRVRLVIVEDAGSAGVRGKRTDHDVVTVRIAKRELQSAGLRIPMRLLLELMDERPCALQAALEIINPKEQEQAVTGLSILRALQWRMVVSTPFMEAEQNGSILASYLPEVAMLWC